MSDDDEPIVERRSMVGAPPTSLINRRAFATPKSSARTPSSRSAKSSKRKREPEPESDEDEAPAKNEDEAGDIEESAEDDDEEETKGKPKPKKRRRTLLTNSVSRKKRNDARKQAAKEAKEAAGYESPEEEKPPTPKEPTPEPVVKVPCVTKYGPLQLLCDHLLRKLQSKDPEEFFAFPVTASMAPDYHTIITKPMDFSLIRQKIEENEYESVPQMRIDCDLIVSNALTYNNPHTVYHLAATKLSQIIRYYFSENYLRYIFHTLPFANKIPLEKVGLEPLMPPPKALNKRDQAVVDKMTAEDCLKLADPKVRSRLSTRVPAKIAFVDNKDGATVLNILSDRTKKDIKLIDIVGPLEEGNPGMLALSDHRLSSVSSINYLNYGPFCSFAPIYDSTWASLTKRDSDLLLRTYGDRSMASEVMSLRSMVADADELFMKAVDDMLDTLTDGEHSRTIATLEKKKDEIADDIPMDQLLSEIETLENIGIDVGFVNDLRQKTGHPKPNDLQSRLDNTGQALMDLAHLQHERLSKPPPIPLTKAPLPTSVELQLAGNIQQQLSTQIATHATPGQLVSAPAIHNVIGLQEEDMDILGEFFM